MQQRALQPRLSVFLLLWLCVGWALTLGGPDGVAQRPDNGGVYGHVFCADTQKPARFATVRLIAAARGNGSGFSGFGFALATTGLDGSFQMTGVSPGDYYVDVTLAGYVQPMRGLRPADLQQLPQAEQEKVTALLTRVTVLANQSVAAQVTVYRGGVLAGTVTYDDGSIAPDVSVMALPADPDATVTGDATPGHVRRFGNSNQTDDRGRFRITGLPDGLYTLQAWPRTMLPTFLGNTANRSRAKKVLIRGNDEHVGADIQVPVLGLHRVGGSVIAGKDGHGLARVTVSLKLEGDANAQEVTATTAADGSFLITTVPDGRYTATVAGAYDTSLQMSFGSGSAVVEVSGADVEGVVISLPGSGVSASVND